MSVKDIVIFDLDGTLANIEHRLHFINPPKYSHGHGEQTDPKPDWKAFFEACFKDEPIREIINVLHALSQDDYQIWIVSGRSDQVRTLTTIWLDAYDIRCHKLLMREEGDHQPDDTLKEGWIKDGTIPVDNVLCVFDDRKRVVDMWRRNGLRCLQVAEGEF